MSFDLAERATTFAAAALPSQFSRNMARKVLALPLQKGGTEANLDAFVHPEEQRARSQAYLEKISKSRQHADFRSVEWNFFDAPSRKPEKVPAVVKINPPGHTIRTLGGKS